MKVLFLSSWFPNRNNPFNGDFVERHALAVSGICDVVVIHVLSDDNVKGQAFEVVEKYNQKLYEIIIYFKRNSSRIKVLAKLANLLRYGKGYMMGCKILRKKFGKPDIIHANIIFPIAIVAWLWSLFSETPYIITEHWTLYLSEDSRQIPLGWITRKVVKKAFAITPVTKNLEMALRVHGNDGNFIVVPNVVDTSVFSPNPEPVPCDKIRLLHVSSMKEEQKNIIGIIHAIKRLSDIRKDFVITFVGEVRAHQKLLVRELGFPDDMIIFKGEITHAEVAESMQQAHILVMFSMIENLPCAILEALSCGLPVISSDVGGINEWINENNGLLVKPGNEDELFKGLIFMMENYKKFDRDYLHQYANDNFSKEIIAKRFCEIYESALNLQHDV